MAKATAKPKQKAARAKVEAVKAPAKGNGAAKPQVVTPKANGEKAELQVCKTCGRPFVNEERSSAAKRAWDTIRQNREAGFKTTAERLAAAKAVEEAAKAKTEKVKAVKKATNGKKAKQAKKA